MYIYFDMFGFLMYFVCFGFEVMFDIEIFVWWLCFLGYWWWFYLSWYWVDCFFIVWREVKDFLLWYDFIWVVWGGVWCWECWLVVFRCYYWRLSSVFFLVLLENIICWFVLFFLLSRFFGENLLCRMVFCFVVMFCERIVMWWLYCCLFCYKFMLMGFMVFCIVLSVRCVLGFLFWCFL